MRLFDYINGLKTYVRDDGLLIKVNNKFTAWRLRTRIEQEGFSVNLERNGDNKYVIRVWGAQLRDAYLLKDIDCYAA